MSKPGRLSRTGLGSAVWRYGLAVGVVVVAAALRWDLVPREFHDWVALGLFLAAGALVSWMADMLREARRREREAALHARSAAALRESERQYRALFESMSEGLVTLELVAGADGRDDFRFVSYNPAFVKHSGLDGVAGETVREVMPAIEPPWIDNCAKVVRTGEPVRFQAGAIGRWFDVSAFRIGGAESRRVAVLLADITQQKRAEEAVAAARDELQSTLNSITDGYYALDDEWRVVAVNRVAETHFGEGTNLIGQNIWELTGTPLQSPVYQRFEEVKTTRRPAHFEAQLTPQTGFWTELHLYPREDGLEVYYSDISERKRAEEALARHREELERVVAERTAKLEELVGDLEHFSYTLIHDMRAPLRTMRGFSELMADTCGSCEKEQPKGFLQRIVTSSERMDCLITDALSFTKAVREDLPLEPVDTETLLRGMLDSYPELQPSKANVSLDGAIPSVMANQAGLTQCFSNLLGNAVKFVAPGRLPKVRIRAERRDGRVRVWFEDQGIGIPAKALDRVFDMFHRAHTHYPGTGIGLALVRKVAQRMGGKVGVESEEGKGSRFWIELRAVDEGLPAKPQIRSSKFEIRDK